MPRDLSDPEYITQLQQQLLKRGQYIPGFSLKDKEDLVPQAEMTASSCLELSRLVPDGPVIALENSIAMILPMKPGPVPTTSFKVYTEEPTAFIAINPAVTSGIPKVFTRYPIVACTAKIYATCFSQGGLSARPMWRMDPHG